MKTIHNRTIKYQIFILLFLVTISCFFSKIQVYAGPDNYIRDLDIDILLDEYGNARITEIWDASVFEGTEVYITKDHLGDMELSNIAVFDEEGHEYENIGVWDTDASFEEKAYRCGLHQNGSAKEICFGMSSYGKHVYTIQYSLSNFVSAYQDGIDGFNQKVLNDKLNAIPRHVKVTIHKEGTDFTKDNTKIWSFGYDGNVVFIDGAIVADTEDTGFSYKSYVTIMASFEKGIFTEPCASTLTFQEVKDEAFVGSDYTQKDENNMMGQFVEFVDSHRTDYQYSNSLMHLIFPFVLLAITLIIIKISFAHQRKAFLKKARADSVDVDDGDIEYDRNIPFHGDIYATRCALDNAVRAVGKEQLLGAILLKFLKNGIVAVDEREVSGLLGLTQKKQTTIRVINSQFPVNSVERDLIHILKEAAGEDRILQEKEFFKWSKRNYQYLEKWFDKTNKYCKDSFEKFDGIMEVPQKTTFGLFKTTKKVPSQKGRDMIIHMLGFKKYLLDFTLLNERRPVEVALWDDYLIFATLFGIADQVGKSFRDIYPAFFEEASSFHDYNELCSSISMIGAISYAAAEGYRKGVIAASSSDSRSSGGGGSSSSGGGGGSTGGSSGGGFR